MLICTTADEELFTQSMHFHRYIALSGTCRAFKRTLLVVAKGKLSNFAHSNLVKALEKVTNSPRSSGYHRWAPLCQKVLPHRRESLDEINVNARIHYFVVLCHRRLFRRISNQISSSNLFSRRHFVTPPVVRLPPPAFQPHPV